MNRSGQINEEREKERESEREREGGMGGKLIPPATTQLIVWMLHTGSALDANKSSRRKERTE